MGTKGLTLQVCLFVLKLNAKIFYELPLVYSTLSGRVCTSRLKANNNRVFRRLPKLSLIQGFRKIGAYVSFIFSCLVFLLVAIINEMLMSE